MPRITASNRVRPRPMTKAIKFNGTTSSLIKASPTGINNGTNGSVTLSGWVKLNNNTLQTCAELNATSHAHPSFGIGQTGSVYYVFSDRVNATNNRFIMATQFNQYVNVNSWVLLTYILTPTTVSLYAGATALLDASALTTPISMVTISSLQLGIGSDFVGSAIQPLNGYMKEWRVFNAALTATEISNMYYKNMIPTSVVATYLMEEGSGTSIADSTGSNTLTATAISWVDESPFSVLGSTSARIAIPDSNVAAAAATGTITITDYSGLAGSNTSTNVTIIDYTLMAGGNFNILGMFTLTEGVDFNAVTSNTVTAQNIANAINTFAGETVATVIGDVMTVVLGGSNNGQTIVWTGSGVSPTTAIFAGGADATRITIDIGFFTLGSEVAVGTSNVECATNIKTYLDGLSLNYSVSRVNNVLTITANTPGSSGNSIVLTVAGAAGGTPSGGVTLSGSTLSGGSDASYGRFTIT